MRDGYQLSAHGLLEGGVDLFIIETVQDLLQAKAAIIGCRRAMAEVGREVPIQLQVTIETNGPHAARHRDRRRPRPRSGALKPDVFGLNCATGPREMCEHLRHLSQHCAGAHLRAAQRRPAQRGRRQDALRPHARRAGRVPRPLHHRARRVGRRRVAAAPRPSTCARSSSVCGDLTPAARDVGARSRARRRIYSPVPFDQDTSFLVIGERTNANGSKKFRDAHARAGLGRLPAGRARPGEGRAPTSSTCASTTSAATARPTWTSWPSASPPSRRAPLVLDSTEPPVLEAGLQRLGGRAILNSANLEEGEDEGKRFDRVMSLAPRVRRRRHLPAHRRGGPGPRRRVEAARRPPHPRPGRRERYGLSPSDLIFDTLTFPLSTGDDDLRKDGMATIEAIKRIKAELPGVYTTLGISNVSFGLKPAARHVLNSVFLHEAVQAGLDSAIVHAARIMPLNRMDERQREVVPRPRLRPARATATTRCRSCSPSSRTCSAGDVEKEDRSGWPVEERLKHRIIDGDRDGLEADLDEALQTPRRAGDRQRRAARRHEGRRRPVRVGRDAAAVRAAVGRGHEGVGRLPRAPHGEGRRRRQGPHGARHRQGRRARHRQEPGRHHPHQQRLRGAQPRHQGRHRRPHREGPGGQGRRHRHERPAREEHADHARQPRGAERARAVRDPRAARRRRA